MILADLHSSALGGHLGRKKLLSWFKNDLIGKSCTDQLIYFVNNVQYVNKIKLVHKNRLASCNRWRIQIVVLIMFPWILLLIYQYHHMVMTGSLQLLTDFQD